MRLYLILVGLLLLPMVMAECMTPIGGEIITEDTYLCRGSYAISMPIEIISNNIFLNCNGSILIGSNLPINAVELESVNNVRITACNFSGFATAVNIDDAHENWIVNNVFVGNQIAIGRKNAIDNIVAPNRFIDNKRDVVDISIATNIPPPVIPKPPIQEPVITEEPVRTEAEITIEFEEDTALVFDELRSKFSKHFDESNANIKVERVFIYNDTDGTTTVKMIITPLIPAENYSYYEKIPKCMAKYAKEIIFKDSNYKIILDDPLIMWNFADLSVKSEIEYEVEKELDDDCKKLLEGFGFATDFVEEEQKGYWSLLWGIIITICIIYIIIRIKKAL